MPTASPTWHCSVSTTAPGRARPVDRPADRPHHHRPGPAPGLVPPHPNLAHGNARIRDWTPMMMFCRLARAILALGLVTGVGCSAAPRAQEPWDNWTSLSLKVRSSLFFSDGEHPQVLSVESSGHGCNTITSDFGWSSSQCGSNSDRWRCELRHFPDSISSAIAVRKLATRRMSSTDTPT